MEVQLICKLNHLTKQHELNVFLCAAVLVKQRISCMLSLMALLKTDACPVASMLAYVDDSHDTTSRMSTTSGKLNTTTRVFGYTSAG